MEIRPIGMLQYVHDVSAADTGWIVKPGLIMAALIEVGNARLRKFEHVRFGAERNRLSRAGLGTGRLEADRDAV